VVAPYVDAALRGLRRDCGHGLASPLTPPERTTIVSPARPFSVKEIALAWSAPTITTAGVDPEVSSSHRSIN
jgi:hypothetical protein